MLPQGFSDIDWSATGITTLAITLAGAAIYFLMQQGAFGVKSLYPGDYAYRTMFGKPGRYHDTPKSLFYIATIFDIHHVNGYTLVHDHFEMELVIGGEKRRFWVWPESIVIQGKEPVRKAIFALGDFVFSHLRGNKRTQRVEALVRDALTRRSWNLDDWLKFNTDGIAAEVNVILEAENGTLITAIRLSDLASSEAQVIADKLPGLKLG